MLKRKIIIAKNAGFCFGVKRAVNMVEELLKKKKEVYIVGELIHNHQVIEKLEEKGLRTVKSVKEIPAKKIMVIRSHGAPIGVIRQARKRGIKIFDATCPFVQKARLTAKNFYQKKYDIVICGDKNHAEAIGINSLADNQAKIVASAEEVKKIKFSKTTVGLLSQTTYKLDLLKNVASALLEKGIKRIIIENTICSDCSTKQAEVKKLASKVDLMLVIGGKNSSNTTKLAEISRAVGTKTFHIEKANEIKNEWLKKAKVIGLAAGASTAQFLIDEVKNKLKEI